MTCETKYRRYVGEEIVEISCEELLKKYDEMLLDETKDPRDISHMLGDILRCRRCFPDRNSMLKLLCHPKLKWNKEKTMS